MNREDYLIAAANHEANNPPRWAPGSLAEKVAHYVHTHEEIMAQADAVQRLTVAVAAIGTARERLKREGGALPLWQSLWAAIDEAAAAVEAAERWGR